MVGVSALVQLDPSEQRVGGLGPLQTWQLVAARVR